MHTSSAPSIVLKTFEFSESWILYVDDHLIMVNKPSGMLSVPGRGENKQACLITHIQTRYPEALIVHRLDMDTSGLMVLARNKESHRHLSRQFQERQTKKAYMAVCSGVPSITQGKTSLPMRCDWERRPLQMVDFKQGKYAETHWQIIEQYQETFMVKLSPITGRSHQLRLHMKSLGYPILGDNLYADPISLNLMPRLMLHAELLGFTHPSSLKPMLFNCPAKFDVTTLQKDLCNGINYA